MRLALWVLLLHVFSPAHCRQVSLVHRAFVLFRSCNCEGTTPNDNNRIRVRPSICLVPQGGNSEPAREYPHAIGVAPYPRDSDVDPPPIFL